MLASHIYWNICESAVDYNLPIGLRGAENAVGFVKPPPREYRSKDHAQVT